MTALTPPMGWNSWDSYGTAVTEEEVMANARFMAEHLLPFGWDTVVVDIQWYEPTARAGGYNEDPPVELDAFGRQMPAVNRFPSAAGGAGFGPLATAVHDLGLRFGLHIMRGIPRLAVARDLPVKGTDTTAARVADTSSTCTWNPDNYGLDHDVPGAQAYYDAQLEQFAAWGVDLVKADDMLSPYHDREIQAYHRAIERSGRDIVLSLSPGTHLSTAHLDHLRENAEMWRVSDDLWDRWSDVLDQFGRMARWAPFQRPRAWADADMLPLGRIGIRAERGEDRDSRLTLDEQRTLMSLWMMSRSPLMYGGDLPRSRPETVALLTVPAMIRILQHSRDNREVIREDDLVVWTAEATDADAGYVAVFQLGDEPASRRIPLSSVGRRPGAGDTVTDAWTGEPVAVDGDAVTLDVPAHGSRVLRFDSRA
ncbi:glycoside hydrolase family 27 protein [Clavibacter michiganensis]|uniref:glycoside hydrolase family 27 protein n=1 Tax=Clavibacter michiganensis TaxID=28447 RepID=UPI0026DB03FE|nr:glycoside hydrolase family 27 protein [Clavibacter michiganensis]MDO4070173.1 glycoside hydrolase family 27 protein [Clavibacter michiganensis]